MTAMMNVSLFQFDENKKMLGRIDSTEDMKPEEFDPAWVSQEQIKQAFDEEEENKGLGKYFFALIRNVQ